MVLTDVSKDGIILIGNWLQLCSDTQCSYYNDTLLLMICVQHFVYEDQREAECNVSYMALCPMQHLDT